MNTKKEVTKLEKRYIGDWDYLSNRPFATIAEDLLKCLKEGNLIEEIDFGLALEPSESKTSYLYLIKSE